MPQPTRKDAIAPAMRSAPGRPRKQTRENIIEGAAGILGEQGFEALSMRSLALRLRINHATLYNYFEHIEEIEAEALELLMGHVPMPSAEQRTPMRTQLIEHLLALRELQMQHPKVLHAPVGSRAWVTLLRMQNRVLHALAPHGESLAQTAAAYSALTAFMATSAERARRIGGDYAEVQRRAILAQPESEFDILHRLLTDRRIPGPRIDSIHEIVHYLIDRLLPDIDRVREDIDRRPKSRRSRG